MRSCEYCKSHGLLCVLQWGPKREQLARQLPTPDDAIINEADSRRLYYLRCFFQPTASPNLIQKIMAFYGPSIDCPSLRFAILSALEWVLPFPSRPGEHLHQAAGALASKEFSTFDEGDMFAIAFISYSRSCYVHSDLPGRRAVLDAFPTSSLHVRWFVQTMTKLLSDLGGNFSSYPFAEFWRYSINSLIETLPPDLSDSSFWDLLALSRQLFGPTYLHQFADDMRRLGTVQSFGKTPSDSWYMEGAWGRVIGRNLVVALVGFWTVVQTDMQYQFTRDQRLLLALYDVRNSVDNLEETAVHTDVSRSLPTLSLSSDTPFGALHFTAISKSVDLSVTELLLSLVLDAPSIREATTTPRAINAAYVLVNLVQSLVASVIPASLPSLPHFKNVSTNHAVAFSISSICTAALVYPIFQTSSGVRFRFWFRANV